MKFHPIVEEYPEADDETVESIAEGMRENGFDRLHPIIRWKGRVVDGRTRLKACKLSGTKPQFKDLKGTEIQMRETVERANLHRRHLTPEQRRKLIDARVQRVAESRSEGNSLRTIAEDENVSEKTIRNDLDKAGAEVVRTSTENLKIFGRDGKSYAATKPPILCSRCQRIGAVKDCANCKFERDAAKSGHSEPGTHESRRNGTAKGGKPAYDWRPFRDGVGQCMRQIDTFGRLYGVKESAEAEKLRDQLAAWQKAFTGWAQTVSNLPAPSH